MRLLHFNELGRPVLTDFRGKTVPPYAILSHRWSDSEILFEDISNGTYEKKEEAYHKLKFCAKQAAHNELQYFWIDTCCINMWDRDERSKAINSMFQWYKDASQCYVFLSDVPVSNKTGPVQRCDWEASFRRSKWFTRGWTLQELIAPVSVKFFSCEGEYIGDKALLDQLIHDITSIPIAALRNCALDQFTVSERMKWVKDRKTTEEEDTVYCLLGIVGVSMPVTYGEGRESASRRLQAEVEGAGSAPSIIPFSRNKHFVGREKQLAGVEAQLFSNEQSTTTLAILGSGGTGKSQLALEVAHRTKQNNKNCAIFWIDASEKESIYQSFASVAQTLSIPGGDQADMSQVVKRCVAELSKRQCLLIFDNADTLPRSNSSSKVEAAYLANYLPQSTSCSVIFTTTNSDVAKGLAPHNIIELQELLPETAQVMIENHLSTPLSSTEQQDLSVLLKELSYLPLAIVQAAACMNASSMTVQEYRIQLEKYRKVAPESSSISYQGMLLDSSVEETVAATLSVAIYQIGRTNAVAVNYLCFAACIERRDISIDLLDAASVPGREDAIKILNMYALITRRPAESALDVHRLVHAALRKWLQAYGRFRQWTKHAIVQLIRVYPSDDHANRSKWRRLLPHAQYALSYSRIIDEDRDEDKGKDEKDGWEALDLAGKCAMTLCSDGRFREAEELHVQVMKTYSRVLGEEHPYTLSSMIQLVSIYRNQGLLKEAEELGVQVIETAKRVLGEEHSYTQTSMSNLASTYMSQRRWKEAEELSVQVTKTNKRVLGEEHLDTLASIAILASTVREQGRWKEAEVLQVQVAETSKRVLGEEHPDTLSSISSLAITLARQGRSNEALVLMERCYQLRQRTLGDQHPKTQSSLDWLNHLRDQTKQLDNKEDEEDKGETM
ncbi:kinesin light chain [Paraphoma chrysanthemicola]|uniref:Kinesin light chain n=1 Tax=Paraphoma chrysanthemicola TaxID=798071 RepID=A0A8K0RHM9_9PLEO|nr:kinesin light chain [Paraphoma chrysanthemicola]